MKSKSAGFVAGGLFHLVMANLITGAKLLRPTQMDNHLIRLYSVNAKKYGWKRTGTDGLAFKKGTAILSIIPQGPSFVLVATPLNHPKRGRTTLTRKLFWSDVDRIFNDPRSHTGYGRYKNTKARHSF